MSQGTVGFRVACTSTRVGVVYSYKGTCAKYVQGYKRVNVWEQVSAGARVCIWTDTSVFLCTIRAAGCWWCVSVNVSTHEVCRYLQVQGSICVHICLRVYVFMFGPHKTTCACAQMYTSAQMRLVTRVILHLCSESPATQAQPMFKCMQEL